MKICLSEAPVKLIDYFVGVSRLHCVGGQDVHRGSTAVCRLLVTLSRLLRLPVYRSARQLV